MMHYRGIMFQTPFYGYLMEVIEKLANPKCKQCSIVDDCKEYETPDLSALF